MKLFRVCLLALPIANLFTSEGEVYVTNPSSNNISVIDIAMGAVAATISNSSPGNIVFSPDGSLVYGARLANDDFYVIDVSTRLRTIFPNIGSEPTSIAVSPDGNTVYLSNSDDTVSFVDVTGMPMEGTMVPVGTSPRAVAVSPDGSKVYAANNDGTLSIIDVALEMVSHTVTVGTSPRAVAVSPDGSKVYVANSGDDTISVINPTLMMPSVVDVISVGDAPNAIAFSPSGSQAYVVNGSGNNISIIDVADGSPSNTVAVGSSPLAVAFSPDGSKAYVVNNDDNNVSVIDVANETPGTPITVGTSPAATTAPISYINYFIDGDGDWNDAANWSPQLVPSNSNLQFENARAQFLNLFTGPPTATINSTVTLDGIRYLSDESVTIDAAIGQELIFANNPVISIPSGTGVHIISAPIELTESLAITQETATDFTLSGDISESGSRSITIDTAGNVVLSGDSSYSGGTTLSSGTVTVNSNTGLGTAALQMADGTTLALGVVTAANDVALTGTGTIDVSAGTGTLDGTISGMGANLTKIGAGILELTANNSYTGDTTVSVGTLLLSGTGSIVSSANVEVVSTLQAATDTAINNLSGSGTVEIDNMQILTVNNNVDTVFSGALSGSGTFEKSDVGQLTLTGTSNLFSGLTEVQSGTLVVNGSIADSATTVDVGATLTGTGTLGGLDLLGNLSPGTLSTPLTVEGNATLRTDSNTTVSINDLQEASSLVIPEDEAPGIATIESGAILTVEPVEIGFYQEGMEWVILTAPEVVKEMDGFTLVVEDERFADLQIRYESALFANSPGGGVTLFLPVSVLIGIDTVGLSGNSLILANYLNTLVSVPDLQSALGELAALSGDALKQALASVDPLRVASSTFTLLNTQFAFDQLLFSRLVQQRMVRHFPVFAEANLDVSQLTASLDFPEERKRGSKTGNAWAQGFGVFTHEKGQDTNPSFDAMSGGFLVGFDNIKRESVLAGMGLGYAHNTLTQDHSMGKSSSEMALATLYVGYYDAFFIDVAAWGGYNWIKSSRHVEFSEFSHEAKAKFQSWQVVPHLDLGYSFIFSWGGIEPFVSFDCPFVFTEAFKEHGAAPLDMNVASDTAWMLRSEGGINFYEWWQRETGVFAARQTLSYVNKKPFSVGRVTAAVVGQPGAFTVETFQEMEHLFSPTVEIFFKQNNGVFSSLLYMGEFGSGYMANEVMGKIGVYF